MKTISKEKVAALKKALEANPELSLADLFKLIGGEETLPPEKSVALSSALEPNQDLPFEKLYELTGIGEQTPVWQNKVFLVGFILSLLLGVIVGGATSVFSITKGTIQVTDSFTIIYDSTLTIMIAGVVAIVIAFVKDFAFLRLTADKVEELKNITKVAGDKVNKTIKDNLTRGVSTYETPQDVLGTATEMLQQVNDSRILVQRKLIYIGSASLVKSDDSSEANTAIADYTAVMGSLMNSEVRVEIDRYICLLEPADFQNRSQKTQEEYKNWIKKQIAYLDANDGYVIWDCPRAQAWGSSNSTIITHWAILNMIGNGSAAYRVNGEDVAKLISKYSISLFKDAHIKPRAYHRGDELKGYLSDLDSKPPEQHNLRSTKEIYDAATDILHAAMKDGSSDEFPVIYVGSADLNRDDPLANKYKDLMKQLSDAKIHVRRCFNLTEVEDFENMKPEQKVAYFRWLNRQVELMHGNSHYQLFISKGANHWANGVSTIVTRKSVLYIDGNGTKGQRIDGEEFAAKIRESVRPMFEEHPVGATTFSKVDLESYVQKIQPGMDTGIGGPMPRKPVKPKRK